MEVLFVTRVKSIQNDVRHVIKDLELLPDDIVMGRITKIEKSNSIKFAEKYYLKSRGCREDGRS